VSTDRFAEFADIDFDFTTPEQPAAPAALLLPPGYLSAIDPATGQVVAVRIADQPAPAPVAQPAAALPETALEKALRLAREQPQPLPEQPPQSQPDHQPRHGQTVIWGSFAALAGSTSLWIIADALQKAAPELPEIPEIMRWSVYLVIAVVASVVAVRLLASTKTTQGGNRVTALVHREAHTHIERQTGGFWKGRITNNNS